MNPEERASQNIDALLTAAGWVMQDRPGMNLFAGQGVAVREFPLHTGEADYLLFVDRKAVGVVEAKPEGTTLSGVAEQAGQYTVGLPPISRTSPCRCPSSTKHRRRNPVSR